MAGDTHQSAPARDRHRGGRAPARDFQGARGEKPSSSSTTRSPHPSSQQPLALGADIVYHSATKYLSGHSDTVSGVLATSREDLFERLKFLQNAIGAVPGPFDCFLVLRGIRTLALRIERHSANALAVAQALAARDDIDDRQLPGPAQRPARTSRRPTRGPPDALLRGMVSFIPAARAGRSAEERAKRFAECTHIFALAESLGGVESLSRSRP